MNKTEPVLVRKERLKWLKRVSRREKRKFQTIAHHEREKKRRKVEEKGNGGGSPEYGKKKKELRSRERRTGF